jgi:hypothetical protein
MSEHGLTKVNVRVPRDLHDDLNANVPWGLRRHLLEAVIKLVVDAIRSGGPLVIGAILAGRFSLVRNDQENPTNFDRIV